MLNVLPICIFNKIKLESVIKLNMRTSTQLNLHQLSKLSTRLCQIEYLAVFSALDKNFTFVDRPSTVFLNFHPFFCRNHENSSNVRWPRLGCTIYQLQWTMPETTDCQETADV